MANFSKHSREQLATLHPNLQAILNVAITQFDFVVLEGSRSVEQQKLNWEKGVSKTMNSKHCHTPSLAVDIAPYPIDWNNRERFLFLQGYILGIATTMNIAIRQGIDWDGDEDFTDQSFHDLPHIELL